MELTGKQIKAWRQRKESVLALRISIGNRMGARKIKD